MGKKQLFNPYSYTINLHIWNRFALHRLLLLVCVKARITASNQLRGHCASQTTPNDILNKIFASLAVVFTSVLVACNHTRACSTTPISVPPKRQQAILSTRDRSDLMRIEKGTSRCDHSNS